jgi:hypothetical protein
MNAKGPSAAFDLLESRLPTLKGRKFYGTFELTPEGEHYYACVIRIDSDDPEKMGLETGVIPGGWYARCKLDDWQKNISKLPGLFKELAGAHEPDASRPSLEFYRSQQEMQLFLPVKSHPPIESS